MQNLKENRYDIKVNQVNYHIIGYGDQKASGGNIKPQKLISEFVLELLEKIDSKEVKDWGLKYPFYFRINC